MIKYIEEVVEEVLYRLEAYSEDAMALVMRTGMAESGFKTLKQYGGGPALGFWQVEPATAKDVVDNYLKYRDKKMNTLKFMGFIDDNIEFSLQSNIAVQAAFCRLCYMRDKHAIPPKEDIEAQAKYWKRVYNTHLGKGTIKHFLEMNGHDKTDNS